MISSSEKIYTYEDYAALPEGAPYQLIEGRLVHEPAPTSFHQIIAGNFGYVLRRFQEADKRGIIIYAPIDVYFSDTSCYQPDVVFVARERVGIIKEKRIEGAPDLVGEVLSPGTGTYDLQAKKQMYERSGVREYWIFDPADKSIRLYENGPDGFALIAEGGAEAAQVISSRLLEGFAVSGEEVFSL